MYLLYLVNLDTLYPPRDTIRLQGQSATRCVARPQHWHSAGSELYAWRSLLCCTRSNVERVEADAAVLLGPEHPDADVIGLTLVGGKVWTIEVLPY